MRTPELERKPLIIAAASLLQGCGFSGCKDDMERYFTPESLEQPLRATWRDSQTLELEFGRALQSPAEVDPARFALLRYNIEFERGNEYYCYFELCYDQLSATEAIPESLAWDAAEPQRLRLHFSDAIPASSCDAWGGRKTKYHALELVYAGTEYVYGQTEQPEPEPDQLAYADESGVYEFGPRDAITWVNSCRTGEECTFTGFCDDRGGSGEEVGQANVWVDCP